MVHYHCKINKRLAVSKGMPFEMSEKSTKKAPLHNCKRAKNNSLKRHAF